MSDLAEMQYLQRCLELPEEHALRRAAEEQVAQGVMEWTPWVAIGASRERRWVVRLIASALKPVVYAIESGPVVSMWSLETGAHLGDLDLVSGSARALVELYDGRLRCLTSEGLVLEGTASLAPIRALGAEQVIAHDPCLRRFLVPGAIIDVLEGTTLDTPIAPTTSAFAGGRFLAANNGALQLIHPETGAIETVEAPGAIFHIEALAEPGTAGVHFEIGELPGFLVLDVASKTWRDDAEPPDPIPQALPDGTRFRENLFVDPSGRTVGGWWPEARSARTVHLIVQDRVVIAGSDPAIPVSVIAPYTARALAPVALERPHAHPPYDAPCR